ncbi:MAG: TetR/AcrR family transcriptional regulator [Bacteroidota bacterium]
MKSGTKTRREREKLMRKLHIIDCAETVIRREGLFGLSMDAVAKEAELAKGTLYLYFKNKEEIITQLVLKARQLLLKTFHEAAAQKENPLDQLENMMIAAYEFFINDPTYSELVSFYEASKHTEETGELLQSSLNITAFFVSIVDRGKLVGLIRSELNASQLAYIAWGTSVGMTQLADVKAKLIQDQLQQDSSELYAAYVQLMIKAIKT